MKMLTIFDVRTSGDNIDNVRRGDRQNIYAERQKLHSGLLWCKLITHKIKCLLIFQVIKYFVGLMPLSKMAVPMKVLTVENYFLQFNIRNIISENSSSFVYTVV